MGWFALGENYYFRKIKNMSYNEDGEEIDVGFKMSVDDDEPLEIPEEPLDFGLDEEDPDKDH